jgi:hypothetical protein
MGKHGTSYITRFWDSVRQSKDRRGAPRYTPAEALVACLCWHQGDEHKYTKGTIINVSATGILMMVDEVPPPKGAVWIRLEPPHPTDWVEGDTVRVENHWGEPKTARVRFREACPYDMFKAAVNGFAEKEGFMTLPSDLKNTRFW